jgi:hypothetical protein
MKNVAPLRLLVALTPNDRLGRVVVSLDAFLRFSNEITCDLEMFEDETRQRRSRKRCGQQRQPVDR